MNAIGPTLGVPPASAAIGLVTGSHDLIGVEFSVQYADSHTETDVFADMTFRNAPVSAPVPLAADIRHTV